MRRRGVSLAEALISLLLIALALGLVAGIVREFSSLMTFSSKKDRALSAAQLGLVRMRDESLQALELLSPDTGPSAVLRFRRLSPLAAGRLPIPVPTPAPATWNPFPPADLIVVRYEVSNRSLFREIEGRSERLELAGEVESLSCRLTSSRPANLQLTLTLQDGKRTVALTSETDLPLLP
ncbi:MAG: hypothetical protein AB1758_30080 [Candidatus Eremiobacterota bacterium]